MGGSHDGMISLENRVRGLERIVEEMSREMSIQSGTYNCMIYAVKKLQLVASI